MARADHPAHFLGFRDRRNNQFAGRPFPTRRVCDRAPRWRQPAGTPLESTLPSSNSQVLALTPLRSRIGVPHIPPGQRGITSIWSAGHLYISRFFHLSLRLSRSQRLGDFCENLDAGDIFTFRLPLSECDACGLLRAHHSTRQAPTNRCRAVMNMKIEKH